MKVLVTGATGQLGRDVVTIFNPSHEVIGLSREQFDVSDCSLCTEVIQAIRPDVVIHCAAYTAVDQAESESERAYAINALGTKHVAAAAESIGAKVCYISTDYVFDGTASSPYKAYDQTNPRSVYGQTKRAGEQFIESLSSKYYIVRTSWVYGVHGNNFVKTMLQLSESRDSLKVVHDQMGSPTYTVDLCLFLLDLIGTEKYGIYHASNSGCCSWYEFAKAIFEESHIPMKLEPCTTEEFPRPAPRPRYSVMDHEAIRLNGFTDLRPWREGLQQYLKELKGS